MRKKKVDLGQVFTPKIIAAFMLNLLNKKEKIRILEPCFGAGVFLELLKDEKYEIDGIELDSKLYAQSKNIYKDNKNINLYNLNFLEYSPIKKYDAIVMNPPYIRHEKINDLQELGINKEKIRMDKTYIKLPQNANIYMYFIIKALDLLKEKGELVVIFPNTWIKAKSGKSFLEVLLEKGIISKKILINGKVFGDEALVDVLILKIIKTNKSEANEKKIKEIINYKYNEGKLEKILDSKIQLNEENHKSLSNFANIKRGLTTGYNSFFINKLFADKFSIENIKKILCSPKDIKGYTTNYSNVSEIFFIKKNIKELNINEKIYIEKYKKEILQNGAPKTIYNNIIKGKEWYKLKEISSKGIIFSYIIRNNVKFIWNESSDIVVRDNFYVINSNFDEKLLFVLLNNIYTFYRLEELGKLYGGGLLKLQKYDLDNLKIINPECILDEDIFLLRKLADELIENSNEKIIFEITKLLSKYESIEYLEILKKYEEKKKIRLK